LLLLFSLSLKSSRSNLILLRSSSPSLWEEIKEGTVEG
jgi:hypothetical protein